MSLIFRVLPIAITTDLLLMFVVVLNGISFSNTCAFRVNWLLASTHRFATSVSKEGWADNYLSARLHNFAGFKNYGGTPKDLLLAEKICYRLSSNELNVFAAFFILDDRFAIFKQRRVRNFTFFLNLRAMQQSLSDTKDLKSAVIDEIMLKYKKCRI